MMGIQFGVTSIFQKIFTNSNIRTASLNSCPNSDGNNMTKLQECISAILGGGFTAFCSSPIELIMIQQQVNGGNIIATGHRILSNYGFLRQGMYRGLTATMMRDSIYVFGMLGITPIVQKFLMDPKNLHYIPSVLKTQDPSNSTHYMPLTASAAGFYASMVGGIVGALPSQPFDIIKTCMQGDVQQVRYSSFSSTLRTLWQENGWRRFYNGCFWRTVNITATVYIANECKTLLPLLLYPNAVAVRQT